VRGWLDPQRLFFCAAHQIFGSLDRGVNVYALANILFFINIDIATQDARRHRIVEVQ
jgi:hypothetical protein